MIEEIRELYPELNAEEFEKLHLKSVSSIDPALSAQGSNTPNRSYYKFHECSRPNSLNGSSDDDKFEQFIANSKTPANKFRPIENLKETSFVIDDLSSSEDEQSPTFYRRTLSQRVEKLRDQLNSHSRNSSDGNRKLFVGYNNTRVALNLRADSENHLRRRSSSESSRQSDTSDDRDRHLIHSQPRKKFLTPKVKVGRMKTFSTSKKSAAILNDKKLEKEDSFLSSLRELWTNAKNVKSERQTLVNQLFEMYNSRIFANKLPDDLSITWNARLTKTAGYCRNKVSTVGKCSVIELSEKVANNPARVRDTLIHEMCHAAAWIVDGEKSGHGPFWRRWADHSIQIFPSLPKIKVCHSYDISTKYTYVCIDCDCRIHRHSKSLDTKIKVCGRCRGEFILVNNTRFQNRETNAVKKGDVYSEAVNNKKDNQVPVFAKFVKENYSTIKKEVGPTSTHKDIMSSLSQKFKTMKVTASTQIATICLDD